MKLAVKIELLKFCSAVFNSVFLVLGLSVAGCAVWILFGDSSFLGVVSLNELQVVATSLLVIGGVAAALSLVGCVGASCENRSLLLLYMSFLIILVLGQMFVIILLLINRDKVERSLEGAVGDTIVQYGDGGDGRDRLMDNVQHYGGCCGLEAPADWLMNSFVSGLNLTSADVLPCSCFRSSRPAANSSWCSELGAAGTKFGQGNVSFTEGCRTRLSDWLQENTVTIVGMDAGLILIQMLQFVVAVFLHQSFGRKAAVEGTDALVDHRDPDHTQDELDYGEDNNAYMQTDYVDQDSYFVDPHRPPHPPNQHYQELPWGF